MKYLILVLVLFFTRPSMGETIILPVQDLLYEVPHFINAPKFNLGAAIHGEVILETPKKITRKTKREIERNIINYNSFLIKNKKC